MILSPYFTISIIELQVRSIYFFWKGLYGRFSANPQWLYRRENYVKLEFIKSYNLSRHSSVVILSTVRAIDFNISAWYFFFPS